MDTKYPSCYWKRRTFVVLDKTAIEGLGYIWSDILYPDCQVWRMNWFAMTVNIHIDDIHGFAATGGKWRYCVKPYVRPFANYTLRYY